MKTIIKGATIINEGKSFVGTVVINGKRIESVSEGDLVKARDNDEVIDASGLWLVPGAIDDQVHFREPGLTHKADIFTESRAAAAGGITSFMEMPNTNPQTVTQELLEAKYQIGAEKAVVNYSFFMGATNDNLEEVLKTDPENVCGVKVFMGSSTGNMLVDDQEVLSKLFANCKMLIATHCEDEETIRANLEAYKAKYGEDIPISCHPEIRSREACYKSSSRAVELAKKHGARLHILHISTKEELSLFEPGDIENKHITAEACVHHMWFTDKDYEEKGTFIKWNPAVKTAEDRDAILEALKTGRIDIVATDHAPHTLEEKQNSYIKAPSGGPLVQHALVAMLEHVKNGKLSKELVVEKMAHAPAKCFHVANRGYIREGYYADLVLVNPNDPWMVSKENILYKCGWSPFEGTTFSSKVVRTFVNGNTVYNNGVVTDDHRGMRLKFNRS